MILDFFFPFYSYIWGIKYSSIIRPWKWLFWDWLENGGGDRKQFYKSRLGDSDILPPWQSMRGKKWSPISDRLFFFVVTTHSWETDGETVETVSDFIFLGSKIPADGDCSHEIKRRLLLGRKVMTNLDSILKSRDVTLPTKVHLVKAMVFPVVMYGCESWNVKKAECWRIDAFELWCWRRLLRVP